MASPQGFKTYDNPAAKGAEVDFKKGNLARLPAEKLVKTEKEVIDAGGLHEIFMTQDKTTRDGINTQLSLANEIIQEIREEIIKLHKRPANEPVAPTDISGLEKRLETLASNLLQTRKYVGEAGKSENDSETLLTRAAGLQAVAAAATPAATPAKTPSKGKK